MSNVKRKIDWANVEGAKDCKRRLHLEEDEDGEYQCPVPHCDHDGFLSRRGCRKHVRSKHSWYSYFDTKPTKLLRKSVQFAGLETEKHSAGFSFYSQSESFSALVGEHFIKWLCGSTGGGKPQKYAQQTANRVLRYLRFCCADDEDELTEETIDFCLGSPALLCRFVDAMQDELKLGHSAQLGYLTAISELMDYRKVSGLSEKVISSFATTEVYIKRARKTIAKKMKIKWARDLDIDNLEAKGCWASLEDLAKVIPYHLPRLTSVLDRCKSEPKGVSPTDLTFATRFLATYLFVKVKGSRPMTYQHLTLEMLEKARSNGGFVDQKMFKTAETYSFDSLLLEPADLELIEQYRQYVRPLLNPKCDYLLVTRNGTQYSKLCDLLSKQVFEAIGKHIHPTRYRQIIETESASRLDANEQQVITEDQKHSSRVAKLHYQKQRSRDVATRAQACMQKLRGEEVCRAGRDVQKCLDLHNDVNKHEGRASDSDTDHPCSTDSGDDDDACDDDDDDDDDDHADDEEDNQDNGDRDTVSGDNGNNHSDNINEHNANDDHDNNYNEHNDNDDHANDNDNDRTGNDRTSNNQIDTDHNDNNLNEKRRRKSSRKLERQVGHRVADSTCRRKSILRFTSDEDICLKRGLVKHGFGRWKCILEDPKLTFQQGRTADSIKKRAMSASFRQNTQ